METLTVKEELLRGLRPDARVDVNSRYLVEAWNARPTPLGLLAPAAIDASELEGFAVAWPFPQLFHGKEVTLLAEEDAIYSVDTSDSPWVFEPLGIYDAEDPSVPVEIPAGGAWHFVELGPCWMLINGACVVFLSQEALLSSETPKALLQQHTAVETGAEFRGRIVLGGFSPGQFGLEPWQAFVEKWAERMELPLPLDFSALEQNWVWWSSIGAGDLLWLLHPEQFLENEALVFRYLEENQFGMMPMPWQGRVLRMLPTDKALIVYGEGGVSALKFEGTTLGLEEITRVGVAGRSAAAGGNGGQVFLDPTGHLWSLGPELQAKHLGYHEFLDSMVEAEPVIVYEPHEDEFYVADGASGYVLTRSGLGQLSRLPTSVCYLGGAVVGPTLTVGEDIGEGETDADHFRVKFQSVDMGTTQPKHLHRIRLSSRSSQALQVRVDRRPSQYADWVNGSWLDVDETGTAVVNAPGVEFQPWVRAEDYSNVNLDYALADWTLAGKRDLETILLA